MVIADCDWSQEFKTAELLRWKRIVVLGSTTENRNILNVTPTASAYYINK